MAATKLLTRDAILAAKDDRFKDIDMPEWGGTVRVRGLSAAERSVLESTYTYTEPGPNGRPQNKVRPEFRVALCAGCIVDGEGNKMFTESDLEALGAKNGAALERVFDAARKLSGITQAFEDDPVQARAKN